MKRNQGAGAPDFRAAMNMVHNQLQQHQTNQALQLLDSVVAHPMVDARSVVEAAQLYASLSEVGRFEAAVDKLVKVSPESPEAWYDLAATKANLGKTNEVIPALTRALSLSAQRLQKNPTAKDLLVEARNDGRFALMRTSPDFQKLVPPK